MNDILNPNTLDFSMVSNNDVLIDEVAIRKSTGSLIDLTGASIIWQLFKPGTRSPLVTKSTATGTITIADQTAALGYFRFQIDAIDTKDFETGCYPHEAVVTFPDGNASTLTAGDQKVKSGSAYIRRELTNQG